MTDVAPHLRAGFWRTRRSAAIAGIIFGVLLLAAMIMLRIALSEGSLQTLQADTQRRTLIRLSLSLVPFAGIAFLWFIGARAARRGRGSAVFHGLHGQRAALSGHAVYGGSDLGKPDSDARWSECQRRRLRVRPRYRPGTFLRLAMRMAAVFTLSVSTVGLRTSALPRWVSFLGYLMALVLLVAAAEQQWTQLVFPSWVLLVSLAILFVRQPSPGNRLEVDPDADT